MNSFENKRHFGLRISRVLFCSIRIFSLLSIDVQTLALVELTKYDRHWSLKSFQFLTQSISIF